MSLSIVGEAYLSWAKKYNIRIKEHECRNCKNKFLSTIPVSDKGMRGLRIPDHGCPEMYNASHYVFVDKELEEKLLLSIGEL